MVPRLIDEKIAADMLIFFSVHFARSVQVGRESSASR
jgi:hypothetical protein